MAQVGTFVAETRTKGRRQVFPRLEAAWFCDEPIDGQMSVLTLIIEMEFAWRSKPHVSAGESVDDERVMTFPKGLLGFPNHTRFALIQTGEENYFFWLQSVDDRTSRSW